MSKFMDAARAARDGVAALWPARKPRAKQSAPVPGAMPMFWIVFLFLIAFAVLLGSTWLLTIFIAGSTGSVDWGVDWRAGNDGGENRWIWFAEARLHLLIFVGLALFCLGIAAFNAVWLHVLHKLHGVFKAVILALGAFTALYMIAGATVVQQWGSEARDRDRVTEARSARAGVAAVDADIASIEREMERLCAPGLTTYQAQACRSGETAWAERVGTARRQNDWQLSGIERALADARQGDRWRADLSRLRRERAVADVGAVEAEVATEQVSQGWTASATHMIEDLRKPATAILGEFLAMVMFGVAMSALVSRRHARAAAENEAADEAHMLEDLRDEPAGTAQPMEPAELRMFDALTGERLEKVRVKKTEYTRRARTRGKPQQVQLEPDGPLADETGVIVDGGSRIPSVPVAEPPQQPSPQHEAAADAEDAHGAPDEKAAEDGGSHEAIPELTEAELLALADDIDSTPPLPDVEDGAHDGEGEEQHDEDGAESGEPGDALGDVEDGAEAFAGEGAEEADEQHAINLPQNEGVMVTDAREQHDAHVRARQQQLEDA